MSDVQIGKLITEPQERDAIHVAIAPVTAAVQLYAGQFVGFVNPSNQDVVGTTADQLIGIVDPFLLGPVPPGARFWMLLLPNTITALRHEWTHPAFDSDSVRWMRRFAKERGESFEDMVAAGEYGGGFGHEISFDREIPDEYWEHYQRITGKLVPSNQRTSYFRCAC